jgi:hypothetical protein
LINHWNQVPSHHCLPIILPFLETMHSKKGMERLIFPDILFFGLFLNIRYVHPLAPQKI